jgi:cytochrome P450
MPLKNYYAFIHRVAFFHHGQKIEKGDAVFISIASANKDETVFPNPL